MGESPPAGSLTIDAYLQTGQALNGRGLPCQTRGRARAEARPSFLSFKQVSSECGPSAELRRRTMERLRPVASPSRLTPSSAGLKLAKSMFLRILRGRPLGAAGVVWH